MNKPASRLALKKLIEKRPFKKNYMRLFLAKLNCWGDNTFEETLIEINKTYKDTTQPKSLSL